MGRVIFLGTGDSLNEERAQTSLAVPVSGGETLLIDASSGTVLLGQLQAAGIPLETVRHLFVTHAHFDHVGGLAPLLTAMASLPATSLSVHATPETLSALKGLLGLTIPGVEDWLGKRLLWRELALGEPEWANDAEVTPFEVTHGLHCVGFRVRRGSSSMTFSADTRSSRGVVEHAREADLLVHEAYGPEGDAERTYAMGHSTAAEAGKVAWESEARRLVLTHFRASRFVDPGELAMEAASAFGGRVEVARDLDAFDFTRYTEVRG